MRFHYKSFKKIKPESAMLLRYKMCQSKSQKISGCCTGENIFEEAPQ